MSKTYSEMNKLETFKDRYRYLKLNGKVASETFGYDRYLNQALYRSKEWKDVRNKVIIRDEGCDLGVPGRVIPGKVMIHHIEPISEKDIITRNPKIFDMDNLICVSNTTHNAIHYGDESLLVTDITIRRNGDTKLW